MYSAELFRQQIQPEEHDQADDDALVVAAQSGSEPAFRELCQRNAWRVFRSISRVARDHGDAEDALQDSLMRAFVNIRQFDRRSTFSTWLTRIGINSALMILRKKQRSCETSFDYTDSNENTRREWDVADAAADPEQHCLLSEMMQCIDRSLGGLPLRLRVVTELRLVQNLALGEIAARLNITVPATKSRLHRAKRRIVGSLHRDTPSKYTQRED